MKEPKKEVSETQAQEEHDAKKLFKSEGNPAGFKPKTIKQSVEMQSAVS